MTEPTRIPYDELLAVALRLGELTDSGHDGHTGYPGCPRCVEAKEIAALRAKLAPPKPKFDLLQYVKIIQQVSAASYPAYQIAAISGGKYYLPSITMWYPESSLRALTPEECGGPQK